MSTVAHGAKQQVESWLSHLSLRFLLLLGVPAFLFGATITHFALSSTVFALPQSDFRMSDDGTRQTTATEIERTAARLETGLMSFETSTRATLAGAKNGPEGWIGGSSGAKTILTPPDVTRSGQETDARED